MQARKFCSNLIREAIKNYPEREIVPLHSDTPTIETVSQHLDSEYWKIFLPPYLLMWKGNSDKNFLATFLLNKQSQLHYQPHFSSIDHPTLNFNRIITSFIFQPTLVQSVLNMWTIIKALQQMMKTDCHKLQGVENIERKAKQIFLCQHFQPLELNYKSLHFQRLP